MLTLAPHSSCVPYTRRRSAQKRACPYFRCPTPTLTLTYTPRSRPRSRTLHPHLNPDGMPSARIFFLYLEHSIWFCGLRACVGFGLACLMPPPTSAPAPGLDDVASRYDDCCLCARLFLHLLRLLGPQNRTERKLGSFTLSSSSGCLL